MRGPHPVPQYDFAAFKSIVADNQSIEYAGILLPDGLDQVDFAQSEKSLSQQSTTRKRCRSLKALTLDGPRTQLSRGLLIELDKYIEIGNLESVKFSRGLPQVSYFENAVAMLPKLKDVSLNFSAILEWHQTQSPLLDAAHNYILMCAPLRTLSLWGWKRVISLQDLINRHGQSLTSLQLHEKEVIGCSSLTESDAEEGPVEDGERGLNLLDVQLIKRNCPKLQDLSIDMTHDEGFDLHSDSTTLQLLHELADSGPQLRKLQIYFTTNGLAALLHPQSGVLHRSGDEKSQSYDSEDPGSVLREYVRSIWKHIYGNATTGERLLDVKLGEWESKASAWWKHPQFHNGSPVGMLDIRRYFEVRPHERDDHVGECEIRMRQK